MKTQVALIGFQRPPAGCEGAHFVRLLRSALFTRPLAGFGAIVLGIDAILGEDPFRVADALRGLLHRVVLCPGERGMSAAVGWVQAGFIVISADADLADHLRRHEFLAARPPSPEHEWIGRAVPRGGRGAKALAALERTRPLRPAAWAGLLGCTVPSLCGLCHDEFGMCSRDVVVLYRVFIADRLEKAGASVWERVAAIDAGDPQGLYRVYRAYRLVLNRGPGTGDGGRGTGDGGRGTGDGGRGTGDGGRGTGDGGRGTAPILTDQEFSNLPLGMTNPPLTCAA